MIPFNRPSFRGAELQYMQEAVARGHISGGGTYGRAAESLLVEMHAGASSLLTTSCTHALELSARLLDLGPGDEVIVPAYTFVSSASAFMWNGARPVFADVRDDTLNVDFDDVVRRITPRTRAICIVHYAGVGAEPDRFERLAQERGLALIEDNAHGLGATYLDRPLGTFGSMSTLSFHETKNITCGEGGALVLGDRRLEERAEILRDKGTDRSRFLRGQVDKYTWVDVGSSWVISDLLAATLVAQLEAIERIQFDRMAIWNRYLAELADWALAGGVRLPVIPNHCTHPAHMFHVRFGDGPTRDRFIDHMRSRGVHCVFHYQALNTSPIGISLGGAVGQCPVAETAGDTLVRLPLFVSLSEKMQDAVIEAVRSFET